MMAYFLDVPENAGIVRELARTEGVRLSRCGPYYAASSSQAIELSREATQARIAVWYSAIAGLRDAEITRLDDDVLWIAPRG
jgi:hypothetical protein